MDSYSNLPHSYDGASNVTLFGDYNFTICDYEVYTLANGNGGSGGGVVPLSTQNISNHSNVNNNMSGNNVGSAHSTVAINKAKYERY